MVLVTSLAPATLAGREFKSKKPRLLPPPPSSRSSPTTSIDDNDPVIVNLLQGEYTSIQLSPPLHDVILTSTEATTCVIAAFLCPSSHRVSMAHFDHPFETTMTKQRVLDDLFIGMTPSAASPMITLLLGGLPTLRGTGRALVDWLMDALQERQEHVQIQIACLGDDVIVQEEGKESPATYIRNLAVRAKLVDNQLEWEAFQPAFPTSLISANFMYIDDSIHVDDLYTTLTPGALLREAAISLGAASRQLRRVTVSASRDNSILLTLPPWTSDEISLGHVSFYQDMATVSDADFLRLNSTSPDAEDASFVPRLRAVQRWILSRALNEMQRTPYGGGYGPGHDDSGPPPSYMPHEIRLDIGGVQCKWTRARNGTPAGWQHTRHVPPDD